MEYQGATRCLVRWADRTVSHLVFDDDLGGWVYENNGPYSTEQIDNMGGRFIPDMETV